MAFARGGCEVRLWDADPAALDQAIERIEAGLSACLAPGDEGAVKQAMARITPCADLGQALTGCGHVQESAPERLELKRALFATVDALAPPDAVLASSSSAIGASRFSADLPGRARILVAHPINPPHLAPLVELCPAPWTDPQAVERTRTLMAQIGQTPIVLAREVTGFVLNRLQWALLGEALNLVDSGVCTAEDVDKVLTDGLALRWAFAGPFEVGHLNDADGLRGYFRNLGGSIDAVRGDLDVAHPIGPELIERLHAALSARIPAAEIPARQAWRDGEILALRRHLADRR
jgi:3-hydroxyacyl-CoA dehydrogenase